MQNQIQYQNQRAVRSCSCCGQQGHAINNCNSPQVLRFIEDATAATMTASSVLTLKNRRPFTNTSLPILKAVAANIRIESSVSNLNVDYLTHLLACFYWNRLHLHVNTRDELLLLQETCRQAATTAAREASEARIQQARFESQQRQAAAAEAEAHRQQIQAEAAAQRYLQLFIRQQTRYATEHVLIEHQRQQTRQAFIQAGLPIPERIAQPFVATPTPATTGPAPMLCLCCNSNEHNISNCKNYRGIPSMNKILSLVCTRTEFRTRLQQHSNLYMHLAFAIQCNFVPSECSDCVLAMNKITDYYYTQDKYHRIRMELQEYIIGCEYQQETGEALETDVIHDPRFKVFQSLIETSEEIKFNRNDPEFITKCIRISDMIGLNTAIPVEITLGFKASTTLPLLTDADADADAKDNDEQCSCAVCLGAWDIIYPTITFGCKHDMCSKCLNTYFKNQNRLRPTCHLCRQPIFHISVPPEAMNDELFQDINIRILRQSDV